MEVTHDLVDIETMPCGQLSANYILGLHRTSMYASELLLVEKYAESARRTALSTDGPSRALLLVLTRPCTEFEGVKGTTRLIYSDLSVAIPQLIAPKSSTAARGLYCFDVDVDPKRNSTTSPFIIERPDADADH
jgi:hypothetical protein